MKHLRNPALAVLILAACTIFTNCHAAESSFDASKRKEATAYVTGCIIANDDDRKICELYRAEFIANYILAWHGSFVDQKNTAYNLTDGAHRAVLPNLMQACAWRLLATRHPEASEMEAIIARTTCQKLAPEAQEAAIQRATETHPED